MTVLLPNLNCAVRYCAVWCSMVRYSAVVGKHNVGTDRMAGLSNATNTEVAHAQPLQHVCTPLTPLTATALTACVLVRMGGLSCAPDPVTST